MTTVLNQIATTVKGWNWLNNEENPFLQNIGNQKVLKLGNQLSTIFTEKNTDKFTISVPNIVVVGSQSSGKSSLLNALIGYDILPTGSNMVTRTPLMVHLNYSISLCKAEFGDYINGRWTVSKSFDMESDKINRDQQSQIHNEIEELTNKLAGNQKGISYQPIHLKIYSPNVSDLCLVDLPGITMIGLSDKGQSKDMPNQIREMIANYVRDPKSIILTVMQARTDLEADMGLELVKMYDSTGSRTCGILTKVDLMNTDTDISSYLRGDISNELKLKYGYYAIRNRNKTETASLTPIEGLAKEQEYFGKHQIYKYIDEKHRLGVKNLGISLSNILSEHIKKNLPGIVDEINKKKYDVEKELIKLGSPIPSDTKGKVSLISNIISNFCMNYVKALEEKCGLNYGLRVKDRFIQFRKELNENLEKRNTDDELHKLVKNCSGNHMDFSIFSIEILEKGIREYKYIQLLKEPCFRLITDVSFLLIELTSKILADKEFSRFPKLVEILEGKIETMINRQQETLKNNVLNLINIEENYIWTENKVFLENLKKMFKEYKNPNDINIIRSLINQYFNTVKFTFCDQIPKMTMYHLVSNIEKKIYTNLFEITSKDEIFIATILEEPGEIGEQRAKLDKFRTKLNRAKKLLSRDMD